MRSAPVELKVGGQTYRVISSAEEKDLRRLADNVEQRICRLAQGRQGGQQALLLAALEYAYELETAERARRELEHRHRTALRAVLGRIDAALAGAPTDATPSAADPELDFDADPDPDPTPGPEFSGDPLTPFGA